MTGMQPLTMASNNLAEDGVSPAGLKQKIDLKTTKQFDNLKIVVLSKENAEDVKI